MMFMTPMPPTSSAMAAMESSSVGEDAAGLLHRGHHVLEVADRMKSSSSLALHVVPLPQQRGDPGLRALHARQGRARESP
jgi:hypothetical protein